MVVKTLYRFERGGGGVTVSLSQPEGEYTSDLVRIIADEGKVLTKDGVSTFRVIDTSREDSVWWAEIPAPADL